MTTAQMFETLNPCQAAIAFDGKIDTVMQDEPSFAAQTAMELFWGERGYRLVARIVGGNGKVIFDFRKKA